MIYPPSAAATARIGLRAVAWRLQWAQHIHRQAAAIPIAAVEVERVGNVLVALGAIVQGVVLELPDLLAGLLLTVCRQPSRLLG